MKKTCFKILMLIVAMAVAGPSYAKKLVFLAPNDNNQKVIKRYNRYKHRPRYMGGFAMGYTAVFGVRSNSVMSTDEVEVNVVKRWVQDAAVNDQDNRLFFIEIKNKKASFDYEFLETYEAGIVLVGTEIKSIRMGKVSLVDSFCYFVGNELFVRGMNIALYSWGSWGQHEPVRDRRLLLNRKELRHLQASAL